jgi:hypothetical protein
LRLPHEVGLSTRHGRILRGLVLVVSILCAPAFAQAEAKPHQDFLVTVDGTHVGTARWAWRRRAPLADYRETIRIETVQGEGRSASVETLSLVQDADGWAWQRRLDAGTVARRDAGRIEGGRWWRTPASGQASMAETLPAEVVLLPQRMARLRTFAAGKATSESFPYLDIERQRLVEATLGRCEGGSPVQVRCVEWRTHPASPREHWFFAPDGTLQRVDAQLAGLPLSLVRCTDDCHRRVAQPLDVVGRMVVPSPHRIARSAAQGTLRYVLARADGQPVQAAATGEQAVAMDGPRAVVTICRHCGEAIAETPATLDAYLRANAWVRSEAPSIRRLARFAGRSDQPLDVRMRRLAAQVRKRMRNGADFLGYADAVQALRTGRGDCTEYAVLLAALARAQGIPTRVVVGMAYSSRFTGQKDAFSPHAWVQAYDGSRWVSYDAAFDGFDATHVALATGTGEPGPLFDAFVQLRQLRIERLAAVAP